MRLSHNFEARLRFSIRVNEVRIVRCFATCDLCVCLLWVCRGFQRVSFYFRPRKGFENKCRLVVCVVFINRRNFAVSIGNFHYLIN